MTSPTRTLAAYAATLKYEDIPESVVHRLRLHLLDAAGCALYGSDLPWTQMIRRVVAGWGGTAQASVWNSSQQLPAVHAAFINSVATHAFELDDRRVASYMHPASATLPAGLATAEAVTGVNGRDFIAAVVAGYEVGLRIGKAIGRGAWERGFYSPGLGGAFAAAVTSARLSGLDEKSLLHVFNLTATQISGLYSPTMIKRFNLGRGTYNGMLAVELAGAGFTGVEDVFEAEIGGMAEAYAETPAMHLLTEGLGEVYETANVELKPYVSSRPNHTSIDCILELQAAHPDIVLEEVQSIEIETSTANYRFGAGFDVTSVPAALMSVGYCVAVAFLDGDVFLPQFTEERINRADVQDLLARTTVRANQDFDELGLEMRDMTRVGCTLTDGRTFAIEKGFAKGHPTNPLSDADVVAKFHRLIDDRIGRDRASQLESVFLELDSLESVEAVIQPLRS